MPEVTVAREISLRSHQEENFDSKESFWVTPDSAITNCYTVQCEEEQRRTVRSPKFKLVFTWRKFVVFLESGYTPPEGCTFFLERKCQRQGLSKASRPPPLNTNTDLASIRPFSMSLILHRVAGRAYPR